ncbi:MAG: Tmc redox complex protein TmcD [Desulfotignum sp.]|nr:Tmc redox complex protein TmcD [Desulfotignum sp.]
MEENTSWDWGTELKEIPFDEWRTRFNWVQSPRVSRDGERIAAIVNLDEMVFNVCVNGEVWEGEYEKIWNLTPVSGNGFAAFVARDEEWTMAVNGQEWTQWCDFIWQMMQSPDGRTLGAAFQSDSEYGVTVNDTPWEHRYENLNGAVMAADGTSAAVVQVTSMPGADVEAFKKGVFSVARNGIPQDRRFLNIWDISFDASGRQIGYTVRTNREAYTIVQNDTLWDNRFESVWKPEFLDENSLLAPVRVKGKWELYKNDTPFWRNRYDQLWHLTLSPNGRDVAAIVSAPYGRWSVAVNDKVWPVSWDAMISDIYFSENGATLAAVYKHKNVWDLAVNQTSWGMAADMVFVPRFSADGSVVAIVIEKQGGYQLVVNNRVVASGFSFMANPVISPDGSRILLKGIENGIYKRRIIQV